jgi:hypothetical protein
VNILEAATRLVKQKADPRQYQIYDCVVVKHWPVSRVISALKTNRGALYVAKYRVSQMLGREVERLRKEPAWAR